MNVLVTGATGNVGSRVVRELARSRRPVRAFVRDADRAAALLGDDVELAVGDFGDRDSLAARARRRRADVPGLLERARARSTTRSGRSRPRRRRESSAS